MRVGLIQVDGKMPNLALMKLSAWYKAQGDDVFFRTMPPDVDTLYISCIYSRNAARARGIEKLFPTSEIVLGGYGINGARLPDDVEHTRPDYDLYGCDFSMGFTSRGCIRRCPWCHVPKMEGGIRTHSPIQEFHDPRHKKVLLLDNNILASPKFRENWSYVIEQGVKVCVTQGFDARLVTDEFAGMIADAKCFDTKFREKVVYTAWDNPADRLEILQGIKRLLDAGIPGPRLIVYLLVGYPSIYTQPAQELIDATKRMEKIQNSQRRRMKKIQKNTLLARGLATHKGIGRTSRYPEEWLKWDLYRFYELVETSVCVRLSCRTTSSAVTRWLAGASDQPYT